MDEVESVNVDETNNADTFEGGSTLVPDDNLEPYQEPRMKECAQAAKDFEQHQRPRFDALASQSTAAATAARAAHLKTQEAIVETKELSRIKKDALEELKTAREYIDMVEDVMSRIGTKATEAVGASDTNIDQLVDAAEHVEQLAEVHTHSLHELQQKEQIFHEQVENLERQVYEEVEVARRELERAEEVEENMRKHPEQYQVAARALAERAAIKITSAFLKLEAALQAAFRAKLVESSVHQTHRTTHLLLQRADHLVSSATQLLEGNPEHVAPSAQECREQARALMAEAKRHARAGTLLVHECDKRVAHINRIIQDAGRARAQEHAALEDVRRLTEEIQSVQVTFDQG